jgi:hypothetical protein
MTFSPIEWEGLGVGPGAPAILEFRDFRARVYQDSVNPVFRATQANLGFLAIRALREIRESSACRA